MPISLELGRHFEDFIKGQLDGGRFNDASEVVRRLRLLEDQEKVKSLELAELKAAVRAGTVSGPGVSGEEALDRLGKE